MPDTFAFPTPLPFAVADEEDQALPRVAPDVRRPSPQRRHRSLRQGGS